MLEIGVNGRGGNEVEVGESLGEGGELAFVDLLVEGRSAIRWLLGAKNALNTGGCEELPGPASPKEVEFKLTYLASVVVGGYPLNMEGFSDEKASNGYDSIAYAGGPAGTPNRL